MLSLAGVPGIYFHSLFGSRNDQAGVERTGRYRSINREKLNVHELQESLANIVSIRARVFRRYRQLLEARQEEPAFHPLGKQIIHNLHTGVFAVERIAPDESSRTFLLHNITDKYVELSLPENIVWKDILLKTQSENSIRLQPYQIAWLRAVTS